MLSAGNPLAAALVLLLAGAALPNAARGEDWFAISDAAKESQPHWMTPVVTVTPRLEQEFRYDPRWQDRPRGAQLDTYGGGKALELIPTPDTEVIIGVPAY